MTSRFIIGIVVFALLAAPGVVSGPQTRAAPFVFETVMYGQNQVPPVETVGWGFFRFFFNEDRTEADITVDIKGLPGDYVVSADIHRGAQGSNGPVVKHVADGGYIVTSARVRFTASELQEMAAGSLYISLKTENHPEGELRGQIAPPAGFIPSPAPTAQPQPAAGGGLTLRPPSAGDAGLVR